MALRTARKHNVPQHASRAGGRRADQLIKSRDITMRDVRPATSSARPSTLIQLKVTGISKSNAASESDGGIGALVKFLERRGNIASNKNADAKGISKRQPIRIRKSKLEGDAAILSVPSEDVRSITSANGYTFAGSKITIEMLAPTGPRSSAQFSFSGADSTSRNTTSPSEIKTTLRSVLARRYNIEQKLLDLGGLGEDAELQAVGFKTITQRSFFPVLMTICDEVWPTRKQKEESLVTVRLHNNDLKDLAPVTELAQKFPDLKAVDLSDNKLAEMKNISRWQHKFRHLEHIVLSDNPMEMNVPDFKAQLARWYPKLNTVDHVPLSAADIEAARAKKPLPKIQSGRFDDQGGIAETFLKNFFVGYDSNRKGLVEYYYDADSKFSLDLNTHALRDPSQKTQANEWSSYIRHSRNLQKITNLPARMKRIHKGTDAVVDIFTQLPSTRHPDFATEPQKWLLECREQRNVPDPAGQAPLGVNGLIITVHGEFEEVESKKIRSFDRTFILGPGGPNGIRVLNDMMTVRAYGGVKAFQVEPTPVDPAISEAAEKEMMVLEIMKVTGMNQQYSFMCLQESGFVFANALAAFEKAKASIPAEAFVQHG